MEERKEEVEVNQFSLGAVGGREDEQGWDGKREGQWIQMKVVDGWRDGQVGRRGEWDVGLV